MDHKYEMNRLLPYCSYRALGTSSDSNFACMDPGPWLTHADSRLLQGSFYPASQTRSLNQDFGDLFCRSQIRCSWREKYRTLIVPHAGYDYSGVVAASGYKSIPKDATYKNIFIIASSHREQFSGASVYSAGNYITPLGEAKVNREIANALIENNKEHHLLSKGT